MYPSDKSEVLQTYGSDLYGRKYSDFSIKSHCAAEMAAAQFSLALLQWFSFPSYLFMYLGSCLLFNIRLHICQRILESTSLIGGVMAVPEMESQLYFKQVVGSVSTSCTLRLIGAEDAELYNVALVSSSILDKSLEGIRKISPEGILELVLIVIGRVIPEGITGEKVSCGCQYA